MEGYWSGFLAKREIRAINMVAGLLHNTAWYCQSTDCVLPVDVFFRVNDQKLIYDLQVPKHFALIIIKGNDCMIWFFVLRRCCFSCGVLFGSCHWQQGFAYKTLFSLFVFKACNFPDYVPSATETFLSQGFQWYLHALRFQPNKLDLVKGE